jgi:hypothetical protein
MLEGLTNIFFRRKYKLKTAVHSTKGVGLFEMANEDFIDDPKKRR